MSIPNGSVPSPDAAATRFSGASLPVRNPYTGELDYEITRPTFT